MNEILKLPMNRDQWTNIVKSVASSVDILEDGALIAADQANDELTIFCTELNHPSGWNYVFAEPIPNAISKGAAVGRAYFNEEMNEVVVITEVLAAVQLATANYESGVDDLDYVAYENAVVEAAAGRSQDQEWLHREWDRFIRHITAKPANSN